MLLRRFPLAAQFRLRWRAPRLARRSQQRRCGLPRAARMPTLKEVGTEFHIAERWSECGRVARIPEPSRMNVDAAERTERHADANRRQHPDGPHVPRLLAAGAVGRRATGE